VRLIPAIHRRDAGILISARALRGFIDGLVSTLLPTYFAFIGLNSFHTGAIITATLFGSALLTLIVGLLGHRLQRLTLLHIASAAMIATGIGFASVTWFWMLFIVAIIGTINPSSGDVSVFLPTEQALLPATATDEQRTSLFARYTLAGFGAGAIGALFVGVPNVLQHHHVMSEAWSYRTVFLLYSLIGLALYFLYSQLSAQLASHPIHKSLPLGESRKKVVSLAILFSLDSFGGGFVVQALIVLWLQHRFELSLAVTGAIFFWTGLLSGFSGLVAVHIARRIGLVKTMVFTHIPANVFLITAAFMPNAWLAVACLVFRSALSQMDVPIRTSYVMAIVTPPERAAAASLTNVPRSLASALPPLGAGWMLQHSTFGWPLIAGGSVKIIYDLLLLYKFRNVLPPEEMFTT
jgi:MFS family permease